MFPIRTIGVAFVLGLVTHVYAPAHTSILVFIAIGSLCGLILPPILGENRG